MSRNDGEGHESREGYYMRDCEVGGKLIPAGITSLPESLKGACMSFVEIDKAALGKYCLASGRFSLLVHAEQLDPPQGSPESDGECK